MSSNLMTESLFSMTKSPLLMMPHCRMAVHWSINYREEVFMNFNKQKNKQKNKEKNKEEW